MNNIHCHSYRTYQADPAVPESFVFIPARMEGIERHGNGRDCGEIESAAIADRLPQRDELLALQIRGTHGQHDSCRAHGRRRPTKCR